MKQEKQLGTLDQELSDEKLDGVSGGIKSLFDAFWKGFNADPNEYEDSYDNGADRTLRPLGKGATPGSGSPGQPA